MGGFFGGGGGGSSFGGFGGGGDQSGFPLGDGSSGFQGSPFDPSQWGGGGGGGGGGQFNQSYYDPSTYNNPQANIQGPGVDPSQFSDTPASFNLQQQQGQAPAPAPQPPPQPQQPFDKAQTLWNFGIGSANAAEAPAGAQAGTLNYGDINKPPINAGESPADAVARRFPLQTPYTGAGQPPPQPGVPMPRPRPATATPPAPPPQAPPAPAGAGPPIGGGGGGTRGGGGGTAVPGTAGAPPETNPFQHSGRGGQQGSPLEKLVMAALIMALSGGLGGGRGGHGGRGGRGGRIGNPFYRRPGPGQFPSRGPMGTNFQRDLAREYGRNFGGQTGGMSPLAMLPFLLGGGQQGQDQTGQQNQPKGEPYPGEPPTPEGTAPKGTTPEGTTPEGTTPEGTTPAPDILEGSRYDAGPYGSPTYRGVTHPGSPEHPPITHDVGERFPGGPDGPGYHHVVRMLESGGNDREVTKGNIGRYQFKASDMRELGIRNPNPYNVAQQEQALDLETKRNASAFSRQMGRNPTGAELYIMHQQGTGGGLALIKAARDNPNTPAWQVLRPFYRSSGIAASAIGGNNLPRYGFGPGMSARQFVWMWNDRYNRQAGTQMAAAGG